MTKLTKAVIDRFQYQGDGVSRDARWDTVLPGFGVRIYPSGRKSFVLSYRAQGRKRMMVLGNYGVLTLEEARRQARKRLVHIQEGRDPIEEKRRDTQGRTFGDLIETYITRHAKPHKKTWETDRDRLKRHVPAGWPGRKVSMITREDVATVHARIGATRPYEANRFLDLLRVMFRFARLWYFVDATADNPAEGVTKFAEHKRKRWVRPEELPALAQAIDAEPNVYVRAAVWLYLLTGLRKTELLQARRDDVDWNRGTLRLPETKSGEEQSATLSGPALAILQSVPQQEGNPYFLCGAKPGHHLVNIEKPWRRIRKAAGIEDVRLHDLRRTTGSWLSQASVDLNLIREALRHQNISTTLTYARLGQDAARDVMEEHGRRILKAAGRHAPLAVVDGGTGKT